MASELRLLRSTDWKPLNEGEYNSDSDIDDNDLNTGDANDDDENEVKEAKLVDVDAVENEKPVDNNDDNDDKNNNNNNDDNNNNDNNDNNNDKTEEPNNQLIDFSEVKNVSDDSQIVKEDTINSNRDEYEQL